RLHPPPGRPGDDLVGRRVGAYRVECRIGGGGMGVVYRARHDRLARPVALKVLPPGAAPDRLARFRDNEQVLSAVVHPNVVRVYEVGEADGRPYLVMEYVAGGTLAERLAEAPLRPIPAARLVAAAARGVAEGHRRGVVHRDLKPANILLENAECGMRNAESETHPRGSAIRDPHSTIPKVADFGLAKAVDPDATGGVETESGAILGTPGYMAPERVGGGRDAGPAADVYGLGAVLYECLTGRPPFKAATPLETLDLVRRQDPAPVRRLQPAVPRDLETVCLKCLEKDPRRRYATADELADDLDRFARGEPVRARPVGWATRAAKWGRRRPTAAVLVGVSALSAAALAAVVAVYTARLRDEADRADRRRAEAAANYRASRDAINRIVARLDAGRAADVPKLGELARDQLEDALAFYQGVLAGRPDPDPEVRLDAGRAWAVAGGLQFALGKPDAAREYLRRAVDLLEGLPPEYRGRPECRAALAHALNYLANLTAGPGDDEAEGYFRRALAEDEAAVTEAPGDPVARTTLARGEVNLGLLHLARRQTDRAEAHLDRAAAIGADLVARHPDDRMLRVDAAGVRVNLGLLYMTTNRPGPAAAAYARAEELARPVVEAAGPRADEATFTLVGAYVNWGELLLGRGDRAGALAKLDRAVALADAAL
ncbi:MAG: protein kinase, partial [Gemmataceae bacterium]|nr:protein kinase [Gemmataceae bacterium]